jgi:hypothetical protein
MQLGTVTNAVDFRDSNKSVFIQWTPKVTANFNLIECINASSNIEMTGFTFVCLDTTTASNGRFLMTDQCDVNVSGSTFVDMDTFVFDKGTTKTVDCTDVTFRRCNTITAGGGDFTGTSVLNSTAATNTSSLIWNVATDPDGLLDNMSFDSTNSTNAIHAIEFGTSSPLTMTLTGIDFQGFNASQNQNDSIFHIKRTTDTVTLNLVGCTSDVSFTNSYRTDGATVVINTVTSNTITVQDTDGIAIEGAIVAVYNSTTDAELSNEETDVNGESSFTAAANTPIYIRVRESPQATGPFDTGTNGVEVTITMNEDIVR